MSTVLFSILATGWLLAWLRVYRPDGEVFRQAEVIAVGSIQPDSLSMFPWVPGGPQEYAAILRVTEVLKGKLDGPEVRIVLHHGLTPVVGGYLREGDITFARNHRRPGVIEIFDTGNSAVSEEPIVADARTDHLWFLSRHVGFYGDTPFFPARVHTNLLGVAEPDEIRPLVELEAVVRWLAAEGRGKE
jgi:hypothetical protein